MNFETLYTVAAMATSESHSFIRLIDVTMRTAPSHVLEAFCTYGAAKILTYEDEIEDAKHLKTADADEM